MPAFATMFATATPTDESRERLLRAPIAALGASVHAPNGVARSPGTAGDRLCGRTCAPWQAHRARSATSTPSRTFSRPSAVGVDASGAVYVADDSRVQKFDAAGMLLRMWGHRSAASGTVGLTIDSSGSVWLADPPSGRSSDSRVREPPALVLEPTRVADDPGSARPGRPGLRPRSRTAHSPPRTARTR